MEFIILLASLILILIMVFMILKKSNPLKLLPGPMPLPIIGNLHQLTGSLPHRILADMAKEYGSLMHLQLGEVSTIIVSSAEVATEIMKEHDIIFANRPYLLPASVLNYNCQDIAFSPYGNYWRQTRKICSMELLSSKRVQTFQPIWENQVLNMIKSISSLEKGSIVNLNKKTFSLTYNMVAQVAFGKRSKYQEEFMSLMEDVIKLMGGFSIVDLYPSVKILERITGMRNKLERVHTQIDAILETILKEHKDKPADSEVEEDLVDVLLKIQKSGEFGAELTDYNLKAIIYDVFSAGGETSSTTIIWAMSEMIKNPTILKRAQKEVRQGKNKELKLLQAVIKETLRMHPPLPLLLPRESSQQCKIKGYVIPAKTRVIINAWAIGRYPQDWTDPEKFNPDRFLDNAKIDFKGKTLSFIPFGAGRRICPGISFALHNIEPPLAQLLYYFDWKLPGNVKLEDLDMTESFGLTVGRKHDLELVPISYRHQI